MAEHYAPDGSVTINDGPGGTGRRVRISGFEEWSIGDDGLIAASLGHYDQAEYERQLAAGRRRAVRPLTDSLDRRLVAVMFTDMVGYTALMQTDERLALEKRDRYLRALESHHAAFGGTIVQRLGDGSMSMFPSSLAAVPGRGRDATGARGARTCGFASVFT